MSIDVNKEVKEISYNGVPLELVGGSIGGTNIDTGLVPIAGFIPETIDGNGYITSGTCYGSIISDYAFYGENESQYNRLTTINLPSNLTKIGPHAFEGCTYLALTSLPSSVTTIGWYAFLDCTNLALTSLPSSLTTIGGYAFSGCTGLTTITFNGTPTSIDSSTFTGCTNLTIINVPWAEGAVSGAPWGATSATINYNYTG